MSGTGSSLGLDRIQATRTTRNLSIEEELKQKPFCRGYWRRLLYPDAPPLLAEREEPVDNQRDVEDPAGKAGEVTGLGRAALTPTGSAKSVGNDFPFHESDTFIRCS
jgi:hypothetical protein